MTTDTADDVTVEGKEIPFPKDEFLSRIAKVQESLATAGLAGLITHDIRNIYYLCGFQTIGIWEYFALLVPAAGDVTLISRALEANNAYARSIVEDTVLYGDGDDPVTVTARAVISRIPQGKVGLEHGSFGLNPRHYEGLKAQLGQGRVADASGTVERVRLVKSPAELEKIRAAGRQSTLSMKAGLDAVAEGETENGIAVALMAARVLAGAEYDSHPIVVASGPRSALPHASWSGRRLEAGDAVSLTTGGCVDRYAAPLIRTVIVGTPSDKQQRAADAAFASLEAVMGMLKPGVVGSDVDATAHRVMTEHGFGEYYWHRAAYSLGLGFPPHWGEPWVGNLGPGNDMIVEEGMAFHTTPSVHILGEFGIPVSESVIVTATGCEAVAEVERRLFHT